MIPKQYHLGDILSITTSHLVSPRHIEGVYDILDYMTGDQLFTHQLPCAATECRPYLLEQLPFLRDIAFDAEGKDWQVWLDRQIAEYGELHPVYPIHAEDHEYKDPYNEAVEMMDGDENRVIPITVDTTPSDTGDINWKD